MDRVAVSALPGLLAAGEVSVWFGCPETVGLPMLVSGAVASPVPWWPERWALRLVDPSGRTWETTDGAGREFVVATPERVALWRRTEALFRA